MRMGLRFSKTQLAKSVFARLDSLYENHKFDRGNGTSQVQMSTPERNRAYGMVMALETLADEFELDRVEP